MGLPTAFLIGSTVASAGVGLVAQRQAKAAADAQSQAQQDFLTRQQENQRQTLIENTRRQQANKMRMLAQVRAQQAIQGANTTSGTPLAIFGDIENRIDEEIDEMTNQALDAIGRTRSQRQNLEFGDQVRAAADPINTMALGVRTLTNFGTGYADNYERFGSDPFGIFKRSEP